MKPSKYAQAPCRPYIVLGCRHRETAPDDVAQPRKLPLLCGWQTMPECDVESESISLYAGTITFCLLYGGGSKHKNEKVTLFNDIRL